MGQTENYVIGLLEEILGKAKRQARFDWALGDPGKNGKRAKLPFDALWEARKVIVEVDEDQHRRSVPFWNKPTISGVSRDEQRRIYDERKRAAAKKHGYTVVPIRWDRRPKPEHRDRFVDLQTLRDELTRGGVGLSKSPGWLAHLLKLWRGT